jgi:hypothetical protein
MLRWLLKDYLDDALRLAGVPCSPSSTHPAPPAHLGAFRPLGQLLQAVQAGQAYAPCAPGPPAAPAARAAAAGVVGGRRNVPERQPPPAAARLALPVSSHSSCGAPVVDDGSGGSSAGDGGGGSGGGSAPGSVLEAAVGWWLNMAASAQLPVSVSVVDILEKVEKALGSVAAQQRPLLGPLPL